MFSLKKILVPIDFSDCSRRAFEYALAVGKNHGSEILVLHVIDTSNRGTVASYALNAMDKVEQAVQTMTHDLMNDFFRDESTGGLVVERMVIPGNPYEVIRRVAESSQVDLIVLGTQGWTPMGRFFFDSVAEKVVRKATCPVLVVRPEEHDSMKTKRFENVHRK